MQFENAEVERRLHQRHRLGHETVLVGHDREDDADGQLPGQRHPHGEVDRDDVLEAEDGFVERAEQDFGAADAHRRVGSARAGRRPA